MGAAEQTDLSWEEAKAQLLGGVPPQVKPSDNGKAAAKADDRPGIKITAEEWQVTDEAMAALEAAPNCYQRMGSIVRITSDPKPLPGIERPEGLPRICQMPKPACKLLLSKHARFYKLTKDQKTGEFVEKRAHPPSWCVDQVLSRGEWPSGIRQLEAIVHAPVLRKDGSILHKPGYDPTTGLYLHGGPFLTPAADPTFDDALEARDVLLDLVADFPFAKPEHRSAWLAGLLTPLARFAYSGPTPLFLLDANQAGTGKGLLARVISQIVRGADLSVMTAPNDDAECGKRLTSLFLEGEPLVLLDEVRELEWATLDAALTGAFWKDRLLCTNTTTGDLPIYTVFFATGNNVLLSAERDTHRRILHVRLETELEAPEARTGFKYPLLIEHVRAERQELVRAVLTVLQAYHRNGRPKPKDFPPFGSFEAWSDLVRGAVCWVGLPDPVDSGKEIAKQRSSVHAQLLTSWRLCFSERRLTIREALNESQRQDDLEFGFGDDSQAAVAEALEGLLDQGQKLTAQSLGKKFQKLEKRICGGMRLMSAKDMHSRVNRWYVEVIDPKAFDKLEEGDEP